MQSHAVCTATQIDLPSGEALLVVEIAVDCPLCGQYTLRLAGHHLRMIRDALVQMIDLHPGLTGTDADVQTLQKLQFGGRGTPRPENN